MNPKGDEDPANHNLEALKGDLVKSLASEFGISEKDSQAILTHRVDIDPAAHKSVFLSSRYAVISPAEVKDDLLSRLDLKLEKLSC